MFPLGEIISSLHLFIDRYVKRITMYAVFYAKPIINRYCQLSSYFHVDGLCVSSHFCAERIAVFHVDAIWQTAVKPHRFHLYRAIVAISPVKRRRVDEWRGSGSSGSSDGDQILTKACSRADEGVAEGEIPLDTNSIKPPAARRIRSLSESGGLLAATSENLQPSCYATAFPILRGSLICRITGRAVSPSSR